MPFREYILRVKGYGQKTKIRRSELRAVTYPIYQLLFKANFKGSPSKPDEFLPVESSKEEIKKFVDKGSLLKKSFQTYNPHLKPK